MIVAWRSWAQRTASWPIDGWKPERCSARSTVSNGSPSIEQCQRDATGAAAGDVEAVVRGLARHPLAMARLHRDGEAADVAAVDRREGAPHRDHFGFVRVRELELLEAVEAAHERRLLAVARPEPERGGGVGDGEREPARVLLEPVREVAQQQQRGRPERRQPERLGVPGARVVAERVEHRIGPGRDADECRHGVSPSVDRCLRLRPGDASDRGAREST